MRKKVIKMTPNQKKLLTAIQTIKTLIPVVEAELIAAESGSVGTSRNRPKQKTEMEIRRIVVKRINKI